MSPIRSALLSALFSSLPLALVACSSSSESPPAPGSPKTDSEVQQLAEASCKAQAEGSSCDADDVASCVADGARCIARLVRRDAFGPFNDCMRGRRCTKTATDGACSCEKSDDACWEETARGLLGTPTRDAYERECLSKLNECSNKFSNDWCTMGDIPWRLFEDRVLEGLRPCFSGACGDVGACLKTNAAAVGGKDCED